MAEAGSWPSIQEHGLESTSALLDRYQVGGATRFAIESQRRTACFRLTHPRFPDVVIRDQKPMSDAALEKCLLDGLTPVAWYRMLNERCFFWLSRDRLRTLLSARAYRGRPQTLLTLTTRSLVEAYAAMIELSPINSGSTIMKPQPRGRETFLSIADYDFVAWRNKRRNATKAVVELVVRNAVSDARDHVVAVHEWTGAEAVEVWRRAGTDALEAPV